MKAKSVNEIQNFTRGGDPYKKMKVGSYDPKTAIDNVVSILSEFFKVDITENNEDICRIKITPPRNDFYLSQQIVFYKMSKWAIVLGRNIIMETTDITEILPAIIKEIYGNTLKISEYIDRVHRKTKKTVEDSVKEIKRLNKMKDILK